MIFIKKPYIYEDGPRAYLKAEVHISQDTVQKWIGCEKILPKTHWRFYEDYPPAIWNNKQSGLYFCVDSAYKNYMCCDRCDAFVVAMLYYAMMTGSDIHCEAPVSEVLLFNLHNHLFPALLKEDKGYSQIHVFAKSKSDPYPTEGKVATGMSCGVDSLYTLKRYTDTHIPAQFRLTHLTYFNMGAIFHPNTQENKRYSIEEFYRITDKMSIEKAENALAVANMQKLPLVYMESNLDKDFYRGAYGYTGVYRNCAMVLALAGLFGKYYCSSAGWPDFFDPNLKEGSEHYETLLCSVFSNGTVSFILSDYATRYEKTNELADFNAARKYLDVCFNFNNCGVCSKCLRTLITFDLLNKLDAFAEVFDVERFKREKVSSYIWLIKTSKGDKLDDNTVFAVDLYNRAKKLNKIPRKAYFKYYEDAINTRLRRFFRQLKSMGKKLLKRP